MKTFYFSSINLGCSKNLVDLEFMIGNIFNLSHEVDIEFFTDPDEEEVEYLIINTCGFLSSSRQEAENLIKEYDDKGKKIIVMGCYTEVKDDDFLSKLKNLYAVIPHNESKNLDLIFKSPSLQTLKSKLAGVKQDKLKNFLKNIGGDNISSKAFVWQSNDVRAYLNADYGYEYLKISEGCDNNCTFCIIPNIRGRQKSRSIEDIISEVKIMINSGIKEIQIISQDLTRYGTDLYKEAKLVDLLEEIDKLEGDFKYRIYYLYPDILTFSHLERLAKLKKMLPYFDIPFQHISPKILKLMGRFYNEEHIYTVLDFIKNNFKNAFIHTNFIVGFPGEDESDFAKLKNFAKKYQFDSVSMFGYHDEVLATSSKLPNKVDDRTIQERVGELREILEEIYDEKYEKRVKNVQVGFIHEVGENKLAVRPEMHAPEVDDLDYIKSSQVISGNIGIGEKIEYKL
ncbi:MAG: MiaB/RimO family radical SAM methylthiotransferase [Candidatus Altimarinota bacterium]